MGLGTGGIIALTAGIGAAGSIASAAIGANAAGNAADQQATSADKALAFQESTQATNQANYAPYLASGSTAISKLMGDLGNGTFGPGSNPAAPQFTGTFHTPTLDEARATPGYQFTLQQGLRGVDAGAAARGGALSGGAAKSEMGYASGLADSTYNDVFNRSLSTFGAGLQGYQANLAGYQANLAKQAQEFSQLYQPASLGENAAAQSGNTAQQVAGNVGSLMTQVGNAQAAGTIGQANAVAGGVTGVTNAAQQAFLLQQYGLAGSAGGGGGGGGALQYDSTGQPIAGTGTTADSIAAQMAAGF
jgi:hypothetical protein